jgi:hypothetical protein
MEFAGVRRMRSRAPTDGRGVSLNSRAQNARRCCPGNGFASARPGAAPHVLAISRIVAMIRKRYFRKSALKIWKAETTFVAGLFRITA